MSLRNILLLSCISLTSTVLETFANCTKSLIPDTAFYPFDMDEVETIIRSQILTNEDVKQIIATEEAAIEDIIKYQSSTASKYAHSSIEELIEKDGFLLETHEVTTVDGYVLTIHRVLGNNSSNGKPIFLYHGLVLSSVDWITVGKQNSIAYFLASRGYDVWMGNARGSKYGRKNVNISAECAEFWDFSFHEIGVIDLPAMVDYVLEIKKQKSLTFIGHSQGSNVAIVLCSKRPEYNKKFDKIISLGTFTYIYHMRSPVFRLLTSRPGLLHTITSVLGIFELPSDMSSPVIAAFIYKIENVICGNNKLAKLLCSNLAFFIFGYDIANINIEILPVLIGHIPGGVSIKQFVHYGQLVNTGKFREFDFGEKRNLLAYNETSPPFYNIDNVVAPTYIVYSNTDSVVTLTDTYALINDLPNVKETYLIPNYSHADFIWSKNLKTDIHPILEKILAQP